MDDCFCIYVIYKVHAYSNCHITLMRKHLSHHFYDTHFEFQIFKNLTWMFCHRKRSSLPEVFCKKGVLKIFARFTWKHLCQSLFFNKVAGTATLLKIESGAGLFLWILWNFEEHLFNRTVLVAASVATLDLDFGRNIFIIIVAN